MASAAVYTSAMIKYLLANYSFESKKIALCKETLNILDKIMERLIFAYFGIVCLTVYILIYTLNVTLGSCLWITLHLISLVFVRFQLSESAVSDAAVRQS